jgi:hypothetical protein
MTLPLTNAGDISDSNLVGVDDDGRNMGAPYLFAGDADF